jgi:hypothetical protein
MKDTQPLWEVTTTQSNGQWLKLPPVPDFSYASDERSFRELQAKWVGELEGTGIGPIGLPNVRFVADYTSRTHKVFVPNTFLTEDSKARYISNVKVLLAKCAIPQERADAQTKPADWEIVTFLNGVPVGRIPAGMFPNVTGGAEEHCKMGAEMLAMAYQSDPICTQNRCVARCQRRN